VTIISLAVVWDDGAVVLAGTGWSRRELLRMITKQQYRKLMNEYQATGNVTNSALKAATNRVEVVLGDFRGRKAWRQGARGCGRRSIGGASADNPSRRAC
jgi:uncharacterized protein YbjT (DUF2867 family)